MGVRGFAKYLASCEVPCCTKETLTAASMLLIDGYAWMFHLFRAVSSNTYKGDGYRDLDAMIRREIEYWVVERQLELVVYFDGPVSHFKSETAAKRREQREEPWNNLYNFVTNGVVYDHDEYPLPPLWSQQLHATLRDCQVRIVKVAGEADAEMARGANEAIAAGRTAYCISEDSDYFFFRDAPYVSLTCLSTKSATVDVYRRSNTARVLGLSESQLVELALLIGNDYTSPFRRSSFTGVTTKNRDIDELKSWLVSQGSEYRLSSTDENLQLVLSFSRDLYELRDVSGYPVDEEDESVEVMELSELDLAELDEWEVHDHDAIGIGDAALAYMEYMFVNSTDAAPTPLSHYVSEQYLQALSMMLDAMSEGDVEPVMSHDVPSWRDLLFTHHYQLVCQRLIKNQGLDLQPRHLFHAETFHRELRNVYKTAQEEVSLKNTLDTSTETHSSSKVLPIDEHRESILNKIARDRVTIIHGETGCGKSSRVPVMILEECMRRKEVIFVRYWISIVTLMQMCKMMVSQPRRIAASSLMKRLRPTLGDQVGLHMGHGVRESSRTTKLYFVTTGYLVRLLAHKPSYFNDHSHIIIDEVHERSVDGDLVCHFVKKLLAYNTNIRVVLMSATMNIELYQNYFFNYGDMRCLSVGARCHPLEINHLEHIRRCLPSRPDIMKCLSSIEASCNRWKPGSDVDVSFTRNQYKLAFELVVNVVKCGTGVLIFVAGMADIVDLSERFSAYKKYKLCYLHSEVPLEEQESAFDPVAADEIKVVIATNAAESSITLPDVDVVICLGMHKAISYNSNRRETMLQQQFICKASATQRAGRTGRVRPGKVYRLYTEDLYNRLPVQGEAEILRSPLEETVLTLRVMLENSSEFTGVIPILEELIEQPPLELINSSYTYLYDASLITEPSDHGFLTPTGRLVGALPVSISLGRLVTYGVRLGVMHEAVILATALCQPHSLFCSMSPLQHRDPDNYNAIVRKAFLCANKYDRGMYSEALMMWQLLEAYRELPQTRRMSWCYRNGLVFSRMRQFDFSARNLYEKVKDLHPTCTGTKPYEYDEVELVNVLRLILVWSSDSDCICVFKAKRKSIDANRITFKHNGTLNESQITTMFPKNIFSFDNPRPLFERMTVPIPAQAFVKQFGILDGLKRVVKLLKDPPIVWMRCQNIEGNYLHAGTIFYINENVQTVVLPLFTQSWQTAVKAERNIYLIHEVKRESQFKSLERILRRNTSIPSVSIVLHEKDSIIITTAHMSLNPNDVENAFCSPIPCIIDKNERHTEELEIYFAGPNEEAALFDDVHLGLKLFNAYKSGYRDHTVRLNKSEEMKLQEKPNEDIVKMQKSVDDGKCEDHTFGLQASCPFGTWRHVESKVAMQLPRQSVVGSCCYLGSNTLVCVAQSMLVINDKIRVCSGVTICPPGSTWIRRALACVDRHLSLVESCDDDHGCDISSSIAVRLKEMYGDDVAYDEELVDLVHTLFDDIQLPQLRPLVPDVTNTQDETSPIEEDLSRLKQSPDMPRRTSSRDPSQYKFPCPLECSTKCLTMTDLANHFMEDHNMRNDDIIMYKSVRMNGEYVLKQRRYFECKHLTCKKKFLRICDADEHYNKTHSMQSVLNGYVTIDSTKPKAESCDPQSMPSHPDSTKIYQLTFPCPEAECTVQCDTAVTLLRHMKKVHKMPKEELAEYRRMWNMASGKSKRCECTFPNCKRRFKNSSAAEAHFLAVHASCSTELSTTDTMSFPRQDTAIVEKESVEHIEAFPKNSVDDGQSSTSEISDPESVTAQYACPQSGCSVVCTSCNERNYIECKHSTCKKKFLRICDADEHYNKTHSMQSMLNGYGTMPSPPDSTKIYQLTFPCPEAECTVQCDTAVTLLRHMKKVHKMPKEELAEYRRMWNMASGKSKRCECTFPNCKRRFKNSSAAEAHFLAVHASCSTELSPSNTLSGNSSVQQTVEAFSKDSIDDVHSKISDPESVTARYACPQSGCSVVCTSRKKLKRHVLKMHNICDEELAQHIEHVVDDMRVHSCRFETCSKRFMSEHAAKEHYSQCHSTPVHVKQTSHPKVVYPCCGSGCAAQYTNMNDLKQHFRAAHGMSNKEIRAYKCKEKPRNGRYVPQANCFTRCFYEKCSQQFLSRHEAQEHFASRHVRQDAIRGFVDASGNQLVKINHIRFAYPCTNPHCSQRFDSSALERGHYLKCKR